VESLSGLKGAALGAAMCKAIADTLGIRNRGAKGEGAGQHSRLGFVQAGGVILELFFISNPDDRRRYLDRKWLVAKAVAGVLAAAAKEA
ncbi:MAG: N-acetylmuramoyl-L-alanine amidase, partial [Armatimonadia bacterium]